jgi:hypothetical protein
MVSELKPNTNIRVSQRSKQIRQVVNPQLRHQHSQPRWGKVLAVFAPTSHYLNLSDLTKKIENS